MTIFLTIILVLSMIVTPVFADEDTSADPGTEQRTDTPDTPAPDETAEPTDEPGPSESPEPSEEPEPTESPEPSPIPLTGVTLSETKLTLKAGETKTLSAAPKPADATDLPKADWTSSNAAVARVDASGKVTAVGQGSAVITVKLGSFSAACTVTVKFADVPQSEYYYDSVYWAVEKKVTTGTTPQTFSPNASCTRAQAVTFLYRINGAPKTGGSHPFKDVPANEYYAAAVRWAYSTGVVRGTSATTFSPDAVCTRGQIISMIWRCRRPAVPQGNGFRDVYAGSYCYNPAKWGAAVGVTKGTEPGIFSPDKVCTRAEIVTMLCRCAPQGYAIYDANAKMPYPRAAAVLDQVGWDLKAAFAWSTRLTYYHDNIDISAGAKVLSDYGFSNLKGDCYVYAATFYTMAIDLGYDAHMVWGYVPSTRGTRATHAWVEIDMDGTTYVFDPNFTYRTHRNGYLIHYGMSGTWMYVDYGRVN